MTLYMSVSGGNGIYVGGSSSVTTSNGYFWANALNNVPVTLEPGDSIYGIGVSGTATASTLTLGGQ